MEAGGAVVQGDNGGGIDGLGDGIGVSEILEVPGLCPLVAHLHHQTASGDLIIEGSMNFREFCGGGDGDEVLDTLNIKTHISFSFLLSGFCFP